MELTSGQRKALFTLVVAALAALGIYMFVPGARGASGASRPPAASHSPAAPAAPSATPSAAPAASRPAPAAAGTPVPDIYQWLPFDQAELGSAAAVATQFSAAYGTFSYSENAAAYAASMRSLIVPALSQVLASSYSVPGVATQRVSKKQVSAGTAVISSLSAFGSSSITFVVAITQQITDTSGRSQLTGQYSVTVTGTGNDWQVNDIELAGSGNS
jgi:hypothetical protein